MNREILFKAKRKDNRRWEEGYYAMIGKRHAIILSQTEKYYTEDVKESHGDEVVEIIPETVSQYTGLTDKNGNRIWEHDIVEYFGDLAVMKKIDEIKYNETHASFCRLHRSQMGLQYLYIDECIAKTMRVIGNVFDNPDLLEVCKSTTHHLKVMGL